MGSYFYSHAFFVRRPKKPKRQYKRVWDEENKRICIVEIPRVPKRADHVVRMRRLFKDYDEWDDDRKLAIMEWDDEQNAQ